MKKWILNVGLTTITVLPIVAVASCSSTTNETPSLTTEAGKYENKTFNIKGTSTIKTPLAAVESLNNATTPAAKLTALQNLVTLNIDETNFVYEVGEAKVAANNSSVEVSMKISVKTNTSSSQTVKFVIGGFTQTESSVQEEAKRFQKTEQANEASKSLKATDVIKTINDATDKLVEFEKLTTVPKPNTGFELKVISAQIGTEQTSVDVKLSIIQTGTENSADATFTITGFAALTASEILEAQASRLTNQVVPTGKQGETPLVASKAITPENLDQYYAPISLTDNITYSYKAQSATPNTSTNTTLDIELIVKSSVAGVNEITRKVQITGFTSPQSLLVAQANLIVDQTALESKQSETAKEAAAAITDTTKLKGYYAPIELATGFSYALKEGSVSAVGDTVRVSVIVSSEDSNTTPIEKTFTISGFKTALEAEADRFAISLGAKGSLNEAQITTRLVVTSINQTADTQEKKLTAINALVDNFPTIDTGYTLNIGTAAIAGSDVNTSTSVTIQLTITQTSTNTPKIVTFTITGLTAETLQQETDRLATTYLVNGPVLEEKASETAAEAAGRITDLTTLQTYYKLTPLPTGFEYNYVSNMVDGDTVKVKLTVSTTSGETTITSQQKEFTITGFKTVALVNLEAQAAKLIEQASLITNQTAAQAKAAITDDTSLNRYYRGITLSNGYGYKYGGKSQVNRANPTVLEVTLSVRNTSTNLTILKVVRISGFQQPTAIEREALRFQTSTEAENPSTLAMGVVSVLNAIDENQEQKLAALKSYVAIFPELTEGYTLSIGLVAPDAATPSSVNVPITISLTTPQAGMNPVTVTYTITDLTVGTPQQQLDTISKLLNNRTVKEGKQTETAAVAQKNLTGDNALNMYYQNTTLPTQFSYRYGGLTEVDKETKTTLNVTLRIAFRDNSLVMFKVVKISGFAQLTSFEEEAQKFAISTPLTATGTTTATAISNINSPSGQEAKLAALKALASNFPATAGYTIVVQTAKINPTTATSIVVPITVSKPASGSEQAPAAVSVNVIITGFAAPTQS